MRYNWSAFQMIASVASEITGVEVKPEHVLLTMAKRRTARVSISPKGLRNGFAVVINRMTSSNVARWATRALGPDATLEESFPLFRAIVQANGAPPWIFSSYQRWAFGITPYRRDEERIFC